MRIAIALTCLSACAAANARSRELGYRESIDPIVADGEACKKFVRSWGPPEKKEQMDGYDFWTYYLGSHKDKILLTLKGCTLERYLVTATH